MRVFGICGTRVKTEGVGVRWPEENPVARLGVVEVADPEIHPSEPGNENKVLVRTRAFSLNFRERRRTMRLASQVAGYGVIPIGSELEGEVVSCGANVSTQDLSPGDRVMLCGRTKHRGPRGYRTGIPTNQASRELALFDQDDLVRVPSAMPDGLGAAFSLNAQTAYALVRRLHIERGELVLVTSARSNLSLMAIQAAATAGATVVGITTSIWELPAPITSAATVIRIDPQESLERNQALRDAIGSQQISAVIDPFCDLHITRVGPLLSEGVRYGTCGTAGSINGLARLEVWRAVLDNGMTMVWNHLGEPEDLHAALEHWKTGRLTIVVDSKWEIGGERQFVYRSFDGGERVGKVVFVYP